MSNVRSSHHNSFPGNEFLTSPFMDTPYDEFLSPNNFDSPVSPDFNTPLMADLSSFEMDSDFNDAPLFDDLATSIYGDYGALTTETAKEVEPIKEHAQPAASASTYTFSPGTPMLDAVDAVDPSSLCHSLRIPKSKETHSSATGTRKHITTASLVPLDAPTQSRHYATPSTTSRKEVPAVFARKRNRSLAFGDEKDEPEVKRDIDVESTTEKDHDVNASKPTIPPFIRSFRAQLDLDGEESDGDEIVYPRGQVIRPQAANSGGHQWLHRFLLLLPRLKLISVFLRKNGTNQSLQGTGTEQMVLDEILDQEHYLSQVVEEGDEQELHSSLSSQAQQSSFIPTGRRRAQIACRNCRRRKVKCVTNEEPPHDPCERCTRMSLVCEYVAVGETKSTANANAGVRIV
ncbi:hypothetical protein D9758_012083 [Tetrapyrgos nigripes]|uniref:Zn(2)-C6 fungal-type domain-containing protein n=1 Tax=Tetrapyrgos nigripes TaxID=182062 RepID=A0A8H5FIW2_9AGAR|nr:hypothetical protein D9758_012083 [Tetrapyrgos nigripes]